MPPLLSAPLDLASAVAKLQGLGLGPILGTLGIGQKSPETSTPLLPPSQRSEAPGWLPGTPDFAGRLPFQSGYAGLSGQPSDGDGLITLRAGHGYRPPNMIEDADGLLVSNLMAKAFKARKEAGEEAQRQGQSEETDALIEELGKAKTRKDAAWDQEVSARSAYAAQQSEAEFQASASQRSRKTTPRPGGYLRMGRGPKRG